VIGRSDDGSGVVVTAGGGVEVGVDSAHDNGLYQVDLYRAEDIKVVWASLGLSNVCLVPFRAMS
jgi:hypothetical protein